mmetsp:Transcript_97657/g.254511  ORF Transcript_97657/g.254511 Transcript_97657/m.254511 type:complete len:272 (+) Transcript_97657:615-1430(+)
MQERTAHALHFLSITFVKQELSGALLSVCGLDAELLQQNLHVGCSRFLPCSAYYSRAGRVGLRCAGRGQRGQSQTRLARGGHRICVRGTHQARGLSHRVLLGVGSGTEHAGRGAGGARRGGAAAAGPRRARARVFPQLLALLHLPGPRHLLRGPPALLHASELLGRLGLGHLPQALRGQGAAAHREAPDGLALPGAGLALPSGLRERPRGLHLLGGPTALRLQDPLHPRLALAGGLLHRPAVALAGATDGPRRWSGRGGLLTLRAYLVLEP